MTISEVFQRPPEKGLQFLRPEKKARFLRKKSHKSGFCSFKEQIICLSFPYFSSRMVIIRFILAAKIVQAPCIFVAYKSIVVFS